MRLNDASGVPGFNNSQYLKKTHPLPVCVWMDRHTIYPDFAFARASASGMAVQRFP